MLKGYSVFSVLFIVCIQLFAQEKNALVAGPMPGHTDLRTAKIWVQFEQGTTKASIFYRSQEASAKPLKSSTIQLDGGEFNTAVFNLTGLEPGTTYRYYISAGSSKKYLDSGTVTTHDFWQTHKPAPSFSFVTGSCSFFNETRFDRAGKPYGLDSSIYETMSKEKSNFMLWLGDNWYTRYADYFSEWGLHYRASLDRSMPVLKNFLKAMPHYAIWDDHDYGPNDADKSYHLKETARAVFKKYWANPSFGMKEEGIYSKFTYSDADFFLLDARWYRSNDRMKDSINGAINPEKKMFGDEQMEWLKNSLLMSSANPTIKFRVIVTGSQVLNRVTRWDAFKTFPVEYYEFMNFLSDNKINGVIFITGDRHHSEIIKMQRKDGYPLYDITVSPLTSSPAKTQGPEATNPDRISKEIVQQNYGRFSFSGEGKERKLTVDFLGIDGSMLDSWSVLASEISYGQ